MLRLLGAFEKRTRVRKPRYDIHLSLFKVTSSSSFLSSTCSASFDFGTREDLLLLCLRASEGKKEEQRDTTNLLWCLCCWCFGWTKNKIDLGFLGGGRGLWGTIDVSKEKKKQTRVSHEIVLNCSSIVSLGVVSDGSAGVAGRSQGQERVGSIGVLGSIQQGCESSRQCWLENVRLNNEQGQLELDEASSVKEGGLTFWVSLLRVLDDLRTGVSFTSLPSNSLSFLVARSGVKTIKEPGSGWWISSSVTSFFLPFFLLFFSLSPSVSSCSLFLSDAPSVNQPKL